LVEREEMSGMLAGLIEKLPPVERTVLSLYYENELAPREIAQVMAMKVARVCQIRTQAVLRLRVQLERRLSVRRQVK
jgi:RNA polymerase sigma factor FliA